MSKSAFKLQGQLLAFVIKEGYKVKYLRIAVGDRELWIKLPKKVRTSLDPRLTPGCYLKIKGTQKQEKTGELKLVAKSVKLSQPSAPEPSTATEKPPKTPARILVCGKSACRKRGGMQVCQVLENKLRDRGLEDQVQIKTTGCLKACKQGPNLIVMPDKKRYQRVQAPEVPAIVAEHFANQDPVTPSRKEIAAATTEAVERLVKVSV
ncbi:MAG: (2Fe-2S) ferredoxin domain-containing protein [Jaaginema sp. PMC 1079.18]|nr:(2Fe-2S) ferredoxin domain-containing protein [Jaaginema sp. PMC 1080.18]MEC4851512.1 (2Fe-2S) ferredoxin domain-containing protein [Jaaginema sp. PMC 1079.18]MEC4868008.1 (2Fe-2S) ferredoxin domain-containing protein [Jaaginema sp. PMC 1078.18]